jgi:hypothetical protein
MYLNTLDMVRDGNAMRIATNRGLDNVPIVHDPPLIFKRGYYGTTDAFSLAGYGDIRGGYIRYYSSRMRAPEQRYDEDFGRYVDVRQPICQTSAWSRQLDDERLQKAWLLSDYATYLNRYEYP